MPGLVLAETGIYKWVAPDGTVIFSDQPRPGAEKVLITPLQTVPPPQTVRRALQTNSRIPDAASSGPSTYRQFAIVSPGDDDAVRSNNGDVTVSMRLAPELRDEDAIVVSLDGEAISKGSSTSLTLQNLPRGTHTVHAAIVDADGSSSSRPTP